MCCSLILLVNAACGGQEQLEQSLKERAQSFWDARIAGDLITLYEFEEYSVRGPLSLQDYVKQGGSIIYNNAKIQKIENIEDDQAVVKVQVDYRIPAMPSKQISSELRDHWVLIDGEWYHQRRRDMVRLPVRQ